MHKASRLWETAEFHSPVFPPSVKPFWIHVKLLDFPLLFRPPTSLRLRNRIQMAHSDPFASIALKAGTHPALSVSHHRSSDIYPALFNWFFASREFNRWNNGESTWQLHCIGGPGSGKVSP